MQVLGWDIAPFGFHRLLKWVAERYRPSGGIVVTENGLPLYEEGAAAAKEPQAWRGQRPAHATMIAQYVRGGAC